MMRCIQASSPSTLPYIPAQMGGSCAVFYPRRRLQRWRFITGRAPALRDFVHYGGCPESAPCRTELRSNCVRRSYGCLPLWHETRAAGMGQDLPCSQWRMPTKIKHMARNSCQRPGEHQQPSLCGWEGVPTQSHFSQLFFNTDICPALSVVCTPCVRGRLSAAEFASS